MKRTFFLLVLVGIWHFGLSQFNDSTHHYLKYAATGIINNTNDGHSFMLNNALSFTLHNRRTALSSNNAWIYGRQDRNLTNNDFSSVLNFDFLKDLRKIYYWGLGTFTTSYSLKINSQVQAGGGIGYNLSKRENLELLISDGILYETGDLNTELLGRDRYHTFRNSLRVKHRWIINNIVTIEGSHFWQPSLSSLKDYAVRSSSAISVKLRKWLSVTTAVTYNKFSRTQRENLLINFGLAAERYF